MTNTFAPGTRLRSRFTSVDDTYTVINDDGIVITAYLNGANGEVVHVVHAEVRPA